MKVTISNFLSLDDMREFTLEEDHMDAICAGSPPSKLSLWMIYECPNYKCDECGRVFTTALT